MALHAKYMIARRYCGPNALEAEGIIPKIVQELRRSTPIHETDAGRVLGLQPAPSCTVPLLTSNEQHRGDSDQQSPNFISDSNAGSDREESQDTGSRNIPRTPQNGPEIPQASRKTWDQTILEGVSWAFRSINFSVNVGGPGEGIVIDSLPDSLSSIDVMKSYGFDSSREGRLRYGNERGIGGQPFFAAWGEAIRQDVLRRNRR
ncbi:hypothetical protein BBP40_011379 [Aspergillus hancockii]|nr:hypothetical protein BBP40_011379 [Aspergillus hancockii]